MLSPSLIFPTHFLSFHLWGSSDLGSQEVMQLLLLLLGALNPSWEHAWAACGKITNSHVERGPSCPNWPSKDILNQPASVNSPVVSRSTNKPSQDQLIP